MDSQQNMGGLLHKFDDNAAKTIDLFDEELDIVDRSNYNDEDDNLIDMLEAMHPSNLQHSAG